MAACHLRSISLPSRSHPLTLSIEEQLYKLKASQSSSIGHKLSGLKKFLECVDNLLQLPHAQRTLSHEAKPVCRNALNESLELLDLCDFTREFFSRMKESVQELELSLRRRKGRVCGLTDEVDAYMVSRKKLNKAICKCLRNLKKKERNCTTAVFDSNTDLTNSINSVQEISLVVFESTLSSISQPMAKSKKSGYLKIEKIDDELLSLKSSKDISLSQLQNLLKELEAFESSIKEAEEELECIYRRLVKPRVSLLNILNH
ncbi:hypothetical protein MANES_13G122400v8 [Manihot esculenta]|uniref:Uncharacterized protein n=1 Tax=Manihot esculenta TaxID=3983 RepID=A0ACB7GMR8_MANES|nr:hypothetical protein MANES_13G122400v8 [Manihot esculenta]